MDPDIQKADPMGELIRQLGFASGRVVESPVGQPEDSHPQSFDIDARIKDITTSVDRMNELLDGLSKKEA